MPRDQQAVRATTGVTAFDALEPGPVPPAFVATTVNEYEVPFVKPFTVHEVSDVVQVRPSGCDVAV